MDISVSRLTSRMALQLPAEFPLGLVFVVGKVVQQANTDNGQKPRVFVLSESGHNLQCRLSERTASEVILNDGDLVRAGGHLAFEPSMAGYYLLARDVEVLEEYQPVTNQLAEVTTETSEVIAAAALAPATLPPWVEELAPPEIRAELERQRAEDAEPIAEPADEWELFVEAETGMNYLAEDPALAGLSDDLIDFLSEAMDSTDDVELTPELLAEFSPDHEYHAPQLTEQDLEALHDLEAALVMTVIRENGGGVKEAEKQGQDLISPQPPEEQAVADSISEANEPQPKAKPTVKRAAKKKSKSADIPWYVVVLVFALALFFVMVLVLIVLFPDGLSLPFTLPNIVTFPLATL